MRKILNVITRLPTHCKLNLNMEYPPPYEWLVWDYKKAKYSIVLRTLLNQ